MVEKQFDISEIAGEEFVMNETGSQESNWRAQPLSGHSISLNRIRVGSSCEPGDGYSTPDDENPDEEDDDVLVAADCSTLGLGFTDSFDGIF